MFLATLMNQSKKWTVYHEPVRRNEYELTPAVVERFKRPNYGEVNSRIRFIAGQVPVKILGVIIRNPQQHSVSLWNRNIYLTKIKHRNARRVFTPGGYKRELTIVDGLVQAGALTIRFEKMVSDREYLEHLLWRFGVHDIPDLEVAYRKARRNKVRETVVETWDGLPADYRKFMSDQFDWYMEKYYGESKAETDEIPNPL
jgi:hypothetical protein